MRKKEKQKKSKNRPRKYSNSSSDEEKETFCLICCGGYSQSKEDWLQSLECKQWANASRAKHNPIYVCNNCNVD